MAKAKTSSELLPYPERLTWTEAERKEHATGGGPSTSKGDYAKQVLEEIEKGSKRKTFASWTLALGKPRGVALFNRSPSSQWWVRGYDLMPLLATWGLDALDGIVACGAGAPAETVLVAQHIDSPRVAPMMAETFARIAKQRAVAEKWLFAHAEAAAIGLVPSAATGRGKSKDFAAAALKHLVEGGRADVVGDVMRRYGVELPDLHLSRRPAKPDVDTTEEVRELEQTLMRASPSNATYDALDRLTRIDSDRALFAVAELARSARSKPLRRRAAQALDAVRERRGLSAEDLADRMVPRLGLDAQTGAFRFVATPTLDDVAIVDAKGARTTKAPPALKKRHDLLRKELRKMSKALRARLETRMIAGAPWPRATFVEHVVGHPILVEMCRALVLRSGDDTFRIAEDGTFADADDDAFELVPDAEVTIAHPLDLDDETIARWSDVFASYELVQPFPQLSRERHHVRANGNRVRDLEGLEIAAVRLLSLERHGWERGLVSHAAVQSLSRNLPGVTAHVMFEPGIPLDDVRRAPKQRITQVTLSTPDPPPRSMSEIARDLRSAAGSR